MDDIAGAAARAPAILNGTTVLELTSGLPGAYCGRLLAMLGADVVKVESLGRPDLSRSAGPFPGDDTHWERSGLFRFLHAQKRSLSLAVNTPTGFRILARLAASADVVLDDGAVGEPPGAMGRYQDLLATNPRLIINAFSPHGLEGPRAGWTSTELTELATGGWLRARGEGSEPLMPGVPCAHYGAGTLGALGVLLALAARRRFGFGQLVETPLNEALLSLLAFPTAMAAFTGSDGGRLGDSFPFAIFKCLDGYLGVSILTQRQWEGLCELMGRQDLVMDPQFRTGAERAQPEVATEITAIIARWIAHQPAQATYKRAQELRVPIAIVPSPGEVLCSPHYGERNYWLDYEDAELGPLRLPGHPFRFKSGDGFAPFRPAPRFGADTASILEAAGYSGDNRRALASAGVI